ncbi:MAG: hypothetical protein QOE70_5769 [Chthoniobacter sp.]|jgi:hypothetical protein|nr:hypothetical protein [Chthoniobacter sp.]
MQTHSFIHDDFILRTRAARRLYHEFAATSSAGTSKPAKSQTMTQLVGPMICNVCHANAEQYLRLQ